MKTPSEVIKELEALESKATPGPWDRDHYDTPFYNDADGHSCGGDATDGFYVTGADDPQDGPALVCEHVSRENAFYIVALKNSALKALKAQEAEIERLKAEVERLKSYETLHTIRAGNFQDRPAESQDEYFGRRQTRAALSPTSETEEDV